MYIWILLATIMVALSFYNLSPRSDKENVFSDVKAATVVNRFRIEHLAAMHAIECELIKNGGSYSNPTTKVTKDSTYGSTSFQANLPIGYDLAGSSLDITHKAFCFQENIIRNPEAEKSGSCSSQNKYMVSYVPIPERWLSKKSRVYTTSDGTEYEIVTPVPSFTNFMARDLSRMRNTGWVFCAGGGCHLIGRGATQYDYNDETEEVITAGFKMPQSIQTEVSATCTATPCLFAIDKMKNSHTRCRGV